MFNAKIYTLIIGIIFIATLSFVYFKYIFKLAKIKKFIINSDKNIKRAYYTLKINKFKISDVNKIYKYKISNEEGEIVNKVLIPIIVTKNKKNYAVFIQPDNEIITPDENIIFTMLISKIKNCVIVIPENFTLKEFKLSF
jgi:hypothetical protein